MASDPLHDRLVENTNPTLYWQAADGTVSAVRLGSQGISFAGSVTPDGQTLFFSSGSFLYRMPLGRPGAAERLLGPQPTMLTPEVSPDGRWLAFQSKESGKPEIYVRPYPNVDSGRWQISTQQGSRPAWSRNGRELFFLDGSGRVNAASIAVSADTLVPGAPRRLLETAYYPGFTTRGANIRGYDVTPDGQRFLMIKGSANAFESRSDVTIVLNWPPKS